MKGKNVMLSSELIREIIRKLPSCFVTTFTAVKRKFINCLWKAMLKERQYERTSQTSRGSRVTVTVQGLFTFLLRAESLSYCLHLPSCSLGDTGG